MPNRIIKESTFTSDKIASLSDFEFRLWVGLITQADDAGRGDARPAIIKGRVFALRDRVTVKDISNALCALAAAGCVSLYTVGGKPYYEFPSWTKHQRIRDCKSKYPGEDEADFSASAATCGNPPQSAATCGNPPPKSNPIQSNPNPNPNTTRAQSALDVAMEKFKKHRKAIKKPLTEDGFALTLAELEKLAPGDDDTKVAIIEQSIQRGWQGVFPLKTGADAKSKPKSGYKYEPDDLERAERLMNGRDE